MKRIAAAILLAILATTAVATENYQDLWWNPALRGMGFNNLIWYQYDSTESPTFLFLSAAPLVGNTVEGTLWRSFGPPPGPGYTPADVETTAVGTARLVFQSGYQASFMYNYDNLSGTIGIERFNFGLEDFSGGWEYVATGVISDCTDPSNNEAYTNGGHLSVSQNGSSLSVTNTDYTGGTCTNNLTLSQRGSYYEGSGTFSCNYGVSGTMTISDARKIDDFFMFEYEAQATNGETCREQSKVAAVED
jgi:hypothetical protein